MICPMKKLFVAMAAVFLALTPVACGGGDDGETTDTALEAKIQEYLSAPKVKIPDRPPPKKVLIKDLKVGTGPAAKPGDRAAIHFVAYAWVTKEEFLRKWGSEPPLVYPRLGSGRYRTEQAILGMGETPPMRVGGRREVVLPNYSQLPAVIFVVQLEKLDPPAEKQ